MRVRHDQNSRFPQLKDVHAPALVPICTISALMIPEHHARAVPNWNGRYELVMQLDAAAKKREEAATPSFAEALPAIMRNIYSLSMRG
ncbi:hypothetical protein NLM27_27505 [Bradyrhizobium sp. CCGB12]|uniref:hypothetical protein n=1 Tax=Bradyrhizobium sp. CCGB12 TaxID=2949632 RepID=UPI0020B28AF7|nr:hypothetical protein [Bradyrhizobium sp. CCGB12]MCP3392496.1 hypothetical protein [Bradyrhizobium sp. CCGB12]